MFFYKKQNILICLVVFSFCLTATTANAQSAGVPTAQVLDTAPTSVTQTKNSVADNLKNFSLDKIATAAAKAILHKMTGDVVNWINTGFKGNPAFLTNPEAFFLDAADQATGELLSKSGPLQNLCSPWSVDLRISIALEQAQTSYNGLKRDRYTCTLGTIINNAQNASVNVSGGVKQVADVDGFITRDFAIGGWAGFLGLTTNPNNNPYGNALMAQSDARTVQSKRQAAISTDLSLGFGFMSWEDCRALTSEEKDDYESGKELGIYKETPDGPRICEKKTPGSVIANSLHDQLQSPVIELETANSINAVLNALQTQLVTQALNKGLSSLSSSGSRVSGYAGSTYLSQIINQATAPTSVQTNTLANQNLQILLAIRAVYNEAISLISTSTLKYIDAKDCFDTKKNLATISAAGRGVASALSSSISNKLSADVSPLLENISNLRNAADTQIQQLSSANTTTIPGATNINALLQNVDSQVSGSVGTVNNTNVSDISSAQSAAEANLNTVQTKTAAYNTEADNLKLQCDTLQ